MKRPEYKDIEGCSIDDYLEGIEKYCDHLEALRDKVGELFAQWDSQMAITSAPTIEEMEKNGVIERKIRQEIQTLMK